MNGVRHDTETPGRPDPFTGRAAQNPPQDGKQRLRRQAQREHDRRQRIAREFLQALQMQSGVDNIGRSVRQITRDRLREFMKAGVTCLGG
jgi:hypothetical protein